MKKFKITDVRAREVLDSRGYPTVEAEVEVDGRLRARVVQQRFHRSHEHWSCGMPPSPNTWTRTAVPGASAMAEKEFCRRSEMSTR